MRDQRRIDTKLAGDILLRQRLCDAQTSESTVDRSIEPTSLPLSLHRTTLEPRSSFVKNLRSAALACQVQPLEGVEKWRERKWTNGNDLVDEVVTPAHRKVINDVISANKIHNKAHRLTKGNAKRRIENQANLADAVGTSQRMISRIIGTANEDSQPIELAATTIYLRRILQVLEIEMVDISVPRDRVQEMRDMAGLPDDEWRALVDGVLRKR